MKTIGLIGLLGLMFCGCDSGEREAAAKRSREVDEVIARADKTIAEYDASQAKLKAIEGETRRLTLHTELMQIKLEQLNEIQVKLAMAPAGSAEREELRGRFNTIKREVAVLRAADVEARAGR